MAATDQSPKSTTFSGDDFDLSDVGLAAGAPAPAGVVPQSWAASPSLNVHTDGHESSPTPSGITTPHRDGEARQEIVPWAYVGEENVHRSPARRVSVFRLVAAGRHCIGRLQFAHIQPLLCPPSTRVGPITRLLCRLPHHKRPCKHPRGPCLRWPEHRHQTVLLLSRERSGNSLGLPRRRRVAIHSTSCERRTLGYPIHETASAALTRKAK